MSSMFLPRRIGPHLSKLASLFPAVLVTGPRQTGKTELSRKNFPKHKWILFDDALLAEQANKDPKLFLQNNPPPFILDEIQKAPGVFPALKEFIDINDPATGSIILTGSQPLQLMELVTESLAGRVGLLELLPMTPAEIFEYDTRSFTFENWIAEPPIGKSFPWKIPPYEFLFRGGFPRMALRELSNEAADASIRLRNYIQTYLTKDLRDLSAISDLGRFERFLRVLSSYSGKILDLSEVARGTDIPQGTAHDWLSLLSASYIFWSAPGYSANLGKRERKRPKGLIVDSGLNCNLMNIQTHESLPKNPLSGFIMETAVANCIRSTLFMNATATPPIYHWNFKNEHEVDFVVEHSTGMLCPIEVKLSASPNKHHCQGLKLFRKSYSDKVDIQVLITTNERCFWIDEDILHIPLSAI